MTSGLVDTLFDVALRASKRLTMLRVLQGILIGAADPDFLECNPRYHGSFLSEAMLRELSRDPQNELSAAFLDRALGKGDQCYGFLFGDTLAAYGWYSTEPTETDLPGLAIHFGDRYVYMYKGFTRAEHRGQRLHAVGMTRALAAYLERGYRGMLSYVEWNNRASLKSCYRMGYSKIGSIYVLKIFDRYLSYSDAACRGLAFRLKRVSPSIDL